MSTKTAPTSARTLLHRRDIACEGYLRADGHYELEGTVTDVRTLPTINRSRGTLPPGEPLHAMTVTLVIDAAFTVIDIAVETRAAPYPATCPAIAPDYRRLVGATMTRGWARTVREAMGGAAGCTHVNELLGRLGETAYLTVFLHRQGGDDPVPGTPPFIDGCHALRRDGPVVALEFPEHAAPGE